MKSLEIQTSGLQFKISPDKLYKNCAKPDFYSTGHPIYSYLRLAPAAPEVADKVPLSPCSPR